MKLTRPPPDVRRITLQQWNNNPKRQHAKRSPNAPHRKAHFERKHFVTLAHKCVTRTAGKMPTPRLQCCQGSPLLRGSSPRIRFSGSPVNDSPALLQESEAHNGIDRRVLRGAWKRWSGAPRVGVGGGGGKGVTGGGASAWLLVVCGACGGNVLSLCLGLAVASVLRHRNSGLKLL